MVSLKSRIRGVLAFPATPFREDYALNHAVLEQHVDALARHPFCCLVPAAGLGELYSLTPEEAVEVVRITVRVVAGRMPVMGGVGFNLPLAVDLARRMEAAGADALLVLPPYYANAPEAGMLDYCAAVGGACGLPLAFYSRDWAVYTPDMVDRLAERVPALQIWKDGQGDMRRYQRIMQRLGDRIAWVGGAGDDGIPAYHAIGVRAFTSSVSAVAPRLPLALADAVGGGDAARVSDLMRRFINPLWTIRERLRGYEVSVMKAALEMAGVAAGPPRPPLPRVQPKDLDDLRQLMATYREFLD